MLDNDRSLNTHDVYRNNQIQGVGGFNLLNKNERKNENFYYYF